MVAKNEEEGVSVNFLTKSCKRFLLSGSMVCKVCDITIAYNVN